jgi:hypothetical protein
MASSDVLPLLEAAPMTRRRPKQDTQRALTDHLRLRTAPSTYWFSSANSGARTATEGKVMAQRAAHKGMRTAGAEIAVAVGIDAAIAQLETPGFLRGETQ